METIEQIPMSHLLDLAWLFRQGMIGWQADARNCYTTYAQLHNLQQTMIAVNSSKKSKMKKPQSFSKMFPEHASLSNLGKAPTNLAEKWLAASAILRGASNGTG